jgi:hypothetical protein
MTAIDRQCERCEAWGAEDYVWPPPFSVHPPIPDSRPVRMQASRLCGGCFRKADAARRESWERSSKLRKWL